jgi:phospholipid-binding lipoprotein MlaA
MTLRSPVCLWVLVLLLNASAGWSQTTVVEETPPVSGQVPFPSPIADPIEPFNRTMGYVNHGFMMGIINPTAYVYRFVIPRPVRNCVNNAGENLAYPVRLVNNLLQAQGTGAWEETKRFGVNTTVGVLGLFDPATKWGIGSYEEDTGKTFRTWGWGPHFYLMLPFFGPSSDPDGVGKIPDMLLNPATYLFPASPIFTYNRLSDEVIRYKQFTSTEYDPYAMSRDVWAVARSMPDSFSGAAPPDPTDDSALQTLGVVKVKVANRKFMRGRKKRNIEVPETGGRLPYSLWLRDTPTQVVYILPGLGGHRETEMTLAVAEQAYNSGFHVVAISSAMNWEFMRQASTAAVPGYQPTDCRDIARCLEDIHRTLVARYPDRVTGRVLLGVSMGAFHTLMIAAGEEELKTQGINFDRYVAIHPPVDLLYGMRQLDSYYNAPLVWEATEREERIERAMEKSAAFVMEEEDAPEQAPAMSNTEAQFLIGLVYRLSLRDIIHDSQRRNDLGVLRSELGSMRRQPAYEEIMTYSYEDYYRSFVLPSVRLASDNRIGREDIERTGRLTTWTPTLRDNLKVRVFTSRNDFLLSEQDLDWLMETFDEKRLVLTGRGGHLGTLSESETLLQIGDLLR